MAKQPTITPLTQVDVQGKTVLLRTDLNVPMADGVITSYARLDAALPTIKYILQRGGGVIVCSHLGRPSEGRFDADCSLAPVAAALQDSLNVPVPLLRDWLSQPPTVTGGQVVMLENIRFCEGESENNENLARALAGLCDVFVMDAFATAHRAHASTCGVAYHADVACSGLLLQSELDALDRGLANPVAPVVAVVGGAKVSSKLEVLLSLAEKVDWILPGGGIANTFLLARGMDVGRSLCEPDMVTQAKYITQRTTVVLPGDVLVGKGAPDLPIDESPVRAIERIGADEAIYDIGSAAVNDYMMVLHTAKTIIWNGPLGIFEQPAYATGTRVVAETIANSSAFTLAGGGDTIAALELFGLTERMSYVSTGGGAFLEYMEGKDLPGIKALQRIKPLVEY